MTQHATLVRRATGADLERLGQLGALLVRQHHEFDQRRFLAPSPKTAHEYGAPDAQDGTGE